MASLCNRHDAYWECENLTNNKNTKAINESEEVQDEALEKEEEKKKAKHKKRGPYRKAHANW
jgi:hypothetical protein